MSRAHRGPLARAGAVASRFRRFSMSFRGELALPKRPSDLALPRVQHRRKRAVLVVVGGRSICYVCCATGTVVVAFSRVGYEDHKMLRSLRPGSADSWASIPDPPIDTLSHNGYSPSFRCVESVIYVASGTRSDSLQTSTSPLALGRFSRRSPYHAATRCVSNSPVASTSPAGGETATTTTAKAGSYSPRCSPATRNQRVEVRVATSTS